MKRLVRGRRRLQEGMVTPIKVADRQDSMAWDGVQAGVSRLIDGIISAEEFLEKIDEIASDRTMAGIRKIWTGEDVPFIAFEHSGGTEDDGIFIQFGIVDGDLYDDSLYFNCDTSITIEDVYNFMKNGSKGGKILKASNGGSLM